MCCLEWQVVPSIWDHVKFAVDHNPDSRFVLTGSSTPVEDVMLHPGTGRFSVPRSGLMQIALMIPLSWFSIVFPSFLSAGPAHPYPPIWLIMRFSLIFSC